MKYKNLYMVLSLLMITSLALAACAPQVATATEAPQAQTEEPAMTEAPTQAATEEPVSTEPSTTRMGAWVDEVIFTEENSAEAAASQLNAGQLDLYAYTVAEAPVFETVNDSPNLTYSQLVGSSNTIMFNPSTFNDGRLNPFSNRKIREAMHWLVDRNYVVQEIYRGLALPRFTVLTTVFPDYARYADLLRQIEAEYAYDADRANEVVTAEMEAMGAEMVDGKWSFEGEPITLIFIIRTEDNRRPIGDYFSSQLESIGFTVDRQYKTRTEASPIWNQSDPAEGLWHLYTGGWISPSIDRDEGDQFSAYFTNRGSPGPLWQAYIPVAELDEAALKLESNNFTSLEERRSLFETALPLSMEEAYQVWVVDEASFSPRVKDLSVASDLAGGAQGSLIWGQTLRFEGREGGTVRIAQPGILVEPWNPIAGTNWIYDSMPQRGLSDNGVISDPYTGLALPQRIERAEVTVREGLPVSRTLDWVDLSFESQIEVPADTWIDWDAANQTFISVGEKFPDGLTANTRTVVYYPEDLYETVAWHDGSPLSAADFVMNMIQVFDQAKPESPIYDEAAVGATEGFLSHFRGVRILSTSPLVIETYDDAYLLDAELIVSQNQAYPNPTWWPQYAFGEGAWHSIALGILAESNNELAFSTDKAGALEVEWTNFVGGPSLEVLKKYLDQARDENYIPYAATLGEYVTADEAGTRYENLDSFYGEHNHFWVNTGPFFLDGVFPVEGTLSLKRNEAYPDMADKWSRFSEAKIAAVEVDGAGQVAVGSEAVFDAYVTFEDQPYANSDISEVKYLLFNAKGELVTSGEATALEDGHFQATLGPDVTSQLESGSNKIEFVVVPSVVSVPSFASFEFVTTE
ncbi:MAG TPA: ABC transporter substrate-binding protein [Anaerolineales bacterium]|nr:ABC transporter substrate-binding protein [Anaerolineales bacterium]